MKIAAIICEYNPFHLGHQRQFREIRAQLGPDTAIVCLMSGNFVQRAEPAVFDKYIRSKAAVLAGADLVLELPVTCAVQSAEGFAGGAVSILRRLGGVEFLSFGAECSDGVRLQAAADALLSDEFPAVLHKYLDQLLPFARARQQALEQLTGDGAILALPNNILAVEYLKALRRQSCAITPLPVRRDGDYHAATGTGASASAAAVRAMLESGGWEASVPESVVTLYAGAAQYRMAAGERAVLARLRSLPESAFSALPYGGEGLWRRLLQASRTQTSVAAILDAAGSKRYPRSRLRRMLLCAFLGISAAELETPPPYVRVLAFSARGRALLRREPGLPLIHAGETGPDAAYFELERRCADLYGLFSVSGGLPPCGEEKSHHVYYLENS